MSGVHCQLEMEDNRLYVRRIGSTNGTYVDGQEMRKNNRYRVFNGATLRLGAENVNGEPYVSYDVDLTGAKEMDRNSVRTGAGDCRGARRAQGGGQLPLHQRRVPAEVLPPPPDQTSAETEEGDALEGGRRRARRGRERARPCRYL